MTHLDELRRALDFIEDQWTIFPQPEMQDWVERDHNSAARISGSGDTGLPSFQTSRRDAREGRSGPWAARTEERLS